jgi:hypothetical protein
MKLFPVFLLLACAAPLLAVDLPSVRFERAREPGGNEGYELVCIEKKPAAECTLTQVMDGDPFRSRKLPLALASEIVKEFFGHLPAKLPPPAKSDIMLRWTVEGEGRKVTGAISRGQRDAAEPNAALDAVLGLEGRLYREVRP